MLGCQRAVMQQFSKSKNVIAPQTSAWPAAAEQPGDPHVSPPGALLGPTPLLRDLATFFPSPSSGQPARLITNLPKMIMLAPFAH